MNRLALVMQRALLIATVFAVMMTGDFVVLRKSVDGTGNCAHLLYGQDATVPADRLAGDKRTLHPE